MANGNLVSKLNHLLANQMVVYVKLRNYHWNITGQQFYNIHNMTEGFYEHFADMVDEVAERIRQLDDTPLSTMQDYLDETTISEEQETSFSAEDVVSRLVDDFSALHGNVKGIMAAAENDDDSATADVMADQIDWLEESLWMMKAFLG